MPNPTGTPDAFLVLYLHDIADDIETHGLLTSGPNFVDPHSGRLDVPAAAYKATTGTLPHVFALPTADAADAARAYIEADPTAMDVLRVIADHLDTLYPTGDWTDDPIDRLCAWPDFLGVTPADVPRTLRDLADTLAAAPAA
ncbi:MAG: hypothetical protein HOY79_33645 [Streptomyces sp.]|nr:hypothetical protein [Streptomyces sp.]NUS11363.1 hypothetical protein [Streptomyces sp.]NUS23496.1 hypothetical protein [Streptomyces sp.]